VNNYEHGRRLFIYIPLVMLISKFIMPFIPSSSGLLTLLLFLYNSVFIYIYPMLVMIILIHKKRLDTEEMRLKIELYSGLAARILIINEVFFMLLYLIGGESLYRFIEGLLGIEHFYYVSFIYSNYFTGLGPTAYFEYAAPYLGSIYELLSGDKYFMYRNNKWITPLLITSIYMVLTVLLLIGLLIRRLRKKVIIFFYCVALLNSLFPFILPIIQYLLYGPVIDYHHFGIMALAIYGFAQLAYLPYNIGRLAELIGYKGIMEVLTSR